jgi:hypothetical protein
MFGAVGPQQANAVTLDCASINNTDFPPAQSVLLDVRLETGGELSVTASDASGNPTEVNIFVQYAPPNTQTDGALDFVNSAPYPGPAIYTSSSSDYRVALVGVDQGTASFHVTCIDGTPPPTQTPVPTETATPTATPTSTPVPPTNTLTNTPSNCAQINNTQYPPASSATVGEVFLAAGESISVTASDAFGGPTSIEIYNWYATPYGGTGSGGNQSTGYDEYIELLAIGAFPGPVSYSQVSSGYVENIVVVVNRGIASFHVTCSDALPPTNVPVPTNTPTATATPAPAVTIDPTRGTVNSYVGYTVIGFSQYASVHITWRRLSGSIIDIGTVQANAVGEVIGKFKVPATTGGPGQLITFTSGNVSKTATFEVAPRIKIIENPVARGQLINVSLRGYAKNEVVRIRWKKGSSWVQVGQVTTSNTGSANVFVTVPSFAPDGLNSVRGDGSVFRAQTNAVNVQGGQFTLAAVSASTATVGPRKAGGISPLVAASVLPVSTLLLLATMRVRRKVRA